MVISSVDPVPLEGSTTLQCTITSLTTPTVQWTTTAADKNFTVMDLVTGVNNSYISVVELTSVVVDREGTYTCEATNNGGTTSDTVSVALGNR